MLYMWQHTLILHIIVAYNYVHIIIISHMIYVLHSHIDYVDD